MKQSAAPGHPGCRTGGGRHPERGRPGSDQVQEGQRAQAEESPSLDQSEVGKVSAGGNMNTWMDRWMRNLQPREGRAF